MTYIHLTCIENSAGPNYGLEQYGCLIFKRLEEFKVFEAVLSFWADALSWPYLKYYLGYLHQTCMDSASYKTYAFDRLVYWI